ncbi:MAG: hypothetical protein K0R39_2353 [Symbiobacteriaceae bacterium]|nr:hypothetical protein [Symbiobacteriaceae bacterium]
MDIRVISGGTVRKIQPHDSILPFGMEAARGRVSTPGNLEGNVGLSLYVNAAAQLEHQMPAVSHVRIIFKEYAFGIRLLIIPLRTKDEDTSRPTSTLPNTYEWKLHKKAPRISGLARLFHEASVPIREDQWYWCTAELVKDDVEGYVVALNWTDPEVEPRSIHAERRRRAEAEKERRRRLKLQKQGEQPET